MTAAELFEARIRREAAGGPLGAPFVVRVDTYLATLRVRSDMTAADHGALRALMRSLAGPEGLAALGTESLAEEEARMAQEDAEYVANGGPMWTVYP